MDRLGTVRRSFHLRRRGPRASSRAARFRRRLRHGVRARMRRWARHRVRTRRSAPRRIALVLLGVGVLLVFVVLMATIPASRSKGHLERGAQILAAAQVQLAQGTFARAGNSFEAAEHEFLLAHYALRNPFVSITASLPFAGRTPDALLTAADTGLRLADAAQTLTPALARLHRKLDNGAPSGRRIPVGRLGRLAPAVSHALDQVDAARRMAGRIATTFVPGSVAEAGDELRAALGRATTALRSADAFLRELPTFAGMEGPARYFLVPQDPAELRGTGGSISHWSILTIDRGRLFVAPFQRLDTLRDVADPVWTSDELQRAYGSLDAAGDWSFANVPADGPTAARFITQLWNRVRSIPIDGVIMVDVHALRSMLGKIGSARVRGIPFPLTSENVVPFVTNRAYFLPGNVDTRREYVGLAGLKILNLFLADIGSYDSLRAMVEAAATGHIVMNAADPAVQEAFTTAGLTGALAPRRAGDLFAVTVNNLAGNKVDYYVHRTIEYDVTLLPGGDARATARVTFRNEAPAAPSPNSALAPLLTPGSGPSNLEAGEAFQLATLTCSAGCELVASTVDGAASTLRADVLDGLHAFTSRMRIPPQSSTTATVTFRLEDVWEGDEAGGTYTLTIPTQPTINATMAEVTIHAPDGAQIAAWSPGMRRDGGAAVWRGTLADITELSVRFALGTFGRIWWGIQNLL